jgi:hypothetical protein
MEQPARGSKTWKPPNIYDVAREARVSVSQFRL